MYIVYFDHSPYSPPSTSSHLPLPLPPSWLFFLNNLSTSPVYAVHICMVCAITLAQSPTRVHTPLIQTDSPHSNNHQWSIAT